MAVDGQEKQTVAGVAVVGVKPLYLCQHVRSALGVPGGYNVAEEKMMVARRIESVSDTFFNCSGSSDDNPATT